MNSNVMSKIKKKNKAYKQFLNSRDGKEYSKARNLDKWKSKKAVRDFQKELSKLAKKNPKAFYKFASSKAKVRQCISDLEKPDGILTTSDKEKAETLNSFFTVEENESPAVQKSTVEELLSNVTFSLRCVKVADSPKAR